MSTAYMLENALPQYAESNGFVVLYPQAAKAPNPIAALRSSCLSACKFPVARLCMLDDENENDKCKRE